jgi:hypothetical protein
VHHHAAVADCHQTSTSTAAYVTKRLGMIWWDFYIYQIPLVNFSSWENSGIKNLVGDWFCRSS